MPHPSHDAPGTLRRAPAPSFAHALCLDQNGSPYRWQIIDIWGLDNSAPEHDDEVVTWPVVYIPAPQDQWAEKTSHLPIYTNLAQHADAQESTR